MILGSGPKPLAADIAIQIPSKDQTAKVAEVRPAHASANRQPDSSLDPKEEIVEPVTTAPPSPSAQPLQQPAASVPAQAKVKDADKPSAGVQAAPAAKAEAKPVDLPDEAARAKALLEGKPDPKPVEKETGRFGIQWAALATKDKVDELQAKLKQAGIKSITQKVVIDSGQRTRIRVGPFSSKEEAEKVRAKIVRLGLNGTVVPA